MRVLGIGHHNALGDLYLRLIERGHEVRVYVSDPEAHDILAGMVPRCDDYRSELGWVRAAGDDGVVLVECTGFGALQDQLRSEGLNVVGGSELGDRLELDRAYGQSVARALGMRTAATHAFEGFDAALAFLDATPGRYVLKFDGDDFAKTRNYVGALDDGEDMQVMLRMQRAQWRLGETPRLVLMEHLSGVEVGVGGFFDGAQFLRPVNLDWEHKRFFPGNLGELTGEMGTLVTYRDGDRLFDATLGRLAPELAASGYVGYINLNLIVNERGAFPLEFTCRLGVPGFAILSALHVDPWDRLLAQLVQGGAGGARRGATSAALRSAPTFATHPGFAVGVVLTVPPFPYADGYERLSKGMPVGLSRIPIVDRARLHFGELRPEGELLVTAGSIGYVMVVTGRGASVEAARTHCYALAERVIVPNVRYRRDIGEAYERGERAELTRLGWLDAPR